MDLVVAAPAIPRPGQTVLGEDFRTIPGGKGANQAVAAARLGADVALVGRVGEDTYGALLREELRAAGVADEHLRTTPGCASGVALIVVAASGENAICVAPGANACVSPADVIAAADTIAAADVCLLQLELPVETVAAAADLARRHGVRVVLDPAPAPVALPDELYAVDVLTPNESEAFALVRREGGGGMDPPRVAEELRARGAQAVALKLGRQGAYVSSPQGAGWCPAYSVPVVDSTAAGDAFTAAVAVAWAEGRGLMEAVRWANAAGALACTQRGAQPAMPPRAAVDELYSRAVRGPTGRADEARAL